MTVAALLLTGGASRRMGCDKGTLALGDETVAERCGRLLDVVASLALEVGPGLSRLPAVPDDTPGAGPLAAVATGGQALRAAGHRGSVLVVATDLPRLTVEMLQWLAGYPASGAVIPVVAGRRQPLCARYRLGDLDLASRLVVGGCQRVAAWTDQLEVTEVGPTDWADAGDPDVLADADTPEEWSRLAGAPMTESRLTGAPMTESRLTGPVDKTGVRR
ncbi:MAG: molybdenum cofactor guanylyltransferase [Acidimicrobiales bacterium]